MDALERPRQEEMSVALLRIETIHPILVHVTIGAVPVFLVAYAIAWWRKSARFSFAGDVAVLVAAAVTVATAAFGLVSNWVLPWPGGLGTYRWVHLGFGAGTTLLLLALAWVRLDALRRDRASGAGALLVAGALAVLVTITGWFGGEALVYHGGMAVRAAGIGALAPLGGPEQPGGIMDAMHGFRASWATATTSVASMVVEKPSDEEFAEIAAAGRRMQRLAQWLEDHAEESEHHHEKSEKVSGGDDHEPKGGGPGIPEHVRMKLMAKQIGADAEELAKHADAKDLPAVAEALGTITSDCADCHDSLRWK